MRMTIQFLLALAFFAYAVRHTLLLLGEFQQRGYKVKCFRKSLLLDKRMFFSLAAIVVLAVRLPWMVWLAPAVLLFGAVMEKEEKLILDKQAQKILVIALTLNMALALNMSAVLAPLYVVFLPFMLIIASLVIWKRKAHAVRK
jgi:hypothetical protein